LAALESIAYQLHDVLEVMRRKSGVPLRGLHGDGGATANAFLMQFVADLTGTELRVAANPHFSALGTAMMGMLGLGLVPSTAALANLPREEIVHRPDMPRETSEAYHAGWQRAVAQVLCGASKPAAA
jgi:glycerol kinase